jgi:hypothetical protein
MPVRTGQILEENSFADQQHLTGALIHNGNAGSTLESMKPSGSLSISLRQERYALSRRAARFIPPAEVS